jgi:transcriptional regulator with GAF, ATPase, and Fis domain
MEMSPTILGIAGPLKGVIYVLTEEEVSIGRDSCNALSINDKALSRRHCVIAREETEFKISDLDSHNGTFVNDVPVKERLLKHEDQIKIGNSYFLFLYDRKPAIAAQEIQFDSGDLVTRSTIRLRLEEALSLMARDLSVIINISAAIHSLSDLKSLQHQLLKSILEIVPAQRGAVILADGNLDDSVSTFSLQRSSDASQPVVVSRTAVNLVLQEKVAILCDDILANTALSKSKSLIESRISSLLCAPLIYQNNAIGAIYLDTGEIGIRFNKNHLQMATSIGAIAASAIENARRLSWLERENERLQADIKIEHNMIGESAPMLQVYQFISRVAPTESTALICGESGTGKELAARAIHENSPRAGKPFVALNCAAITEGLLESELFGHEKGAFTGAIAQKKGKLELADGGTIFLDEIAELAPALQAKLLRVLQEREFERVGGTRTIKVDIRLIAATNKDLLEEIRAGNFRQDLYYRLNVVSLNMPPLRERAGDIQLLASYFVAKHSRICKRRVMGIASQARACLINYDWPGNVRELENAIERAVVLGNTDQIMPEDLPESIIDTAPYTGKATANYYELIKEAKRNVILNAIKRANGNYTEAAKLLGVHPNNLHRLIRTLDMKTLLTK